MRKLHFLIAMTGWSFIFHQSLAAQDQNTNSVLLYLELGGNAIFWSANIEARFKSTEKLGWGFRLGAGGIGETAAFIPLGVNYVFGKQSSPHHFVGGTGVTFLADFEENSGQLLGLFNFMYRFMPVHDGLTFHIGFTPYMDKRFNWRPWFGIGIGRSF